MEIEIYLVSHQVTSPTCSVCHSWPSFVLFAAVRNGHWAGDTFEAIGREEVLQVFLLCPWMLLGRFSKWVLRLVCGILDSLELFRWKPETQPCLWWFPTWKWMIITYMLGIRTRFPIYMKTRVVSSSKQRNSEIARHLWSLCVVFRSSQKRLSGDHGLKPDLCHVPCACEASQHQ